MLPSFSFAWLFMAKTGGSSFVKCVIGEDAAFVRVDLEVDFLGFELDQRLAELHAVAFLLEPPRDARFNDRLTKFRDNDVGHDLGLGSRETPDLL